MSSSRCSHYFQDDQDGLLADLLDDIEQVTAQHNSYANKPQQTAEEPLNVVPASSNNHAGVQEAASLSVNNYPASQQTPDQVGPSYI